MKVYKLDELKELNIDVYLKVIKWWRNILGGTDEGIVKFSNENGNVYDKFGNIYKKEGRA